MEQAILNNNIDENCNCCEAVSLSLMGFTGTPNLYYMGAALEVSNNHLWQNWNGTSWTTFETGGFTPLAINNGDIIRVVHTEPNGCTYYSNVFQIAFP